MLSITIISDAPNCGVTYDHHYDDHNSFIIQATAYLAHSSVMKKIAFCEYGPSCLRLRGNFVAFDSLILIHLDLRLLLNDRMQLKFNAWSIFHLFE